MSTQKLGPVDIEFVLKNVNFKQEAGKMRAEISGISETAKREVDETNRIMRTLGAGLGAYFSFQAIKGLGGELINVRGEFQQMGIALETMLGSKANADKLMAQVVDLSAKTPFSLTQVGQAAKQLLAYQVAQEEVIDTTTKLGNIAAGLSVPLDRLIMAYGQVKAKGKLMGDDLRQFTEAGIPMVSELANAFGVTQAEVYKLVETGKVGFEDVQQVIKNLTDEGGMFFNLMEKQSKSLTGMISNLGDAWDRMLNEIGASNEGVLAGSIKGLTNLVENYEKVIDVIKVIAVTYGAYKAAVVASTIATNGLTIAENLHYAALVIAEKAQKLLNMTSLANPYVALATALTAVIGGLALYSKWHKDISEQSKVLSEVAENVNTQLEHETTILEVYRKRIEQTNPGTRERVKLVKELNDKYPDLLKNVDAENASIETLSTAFSSYIANLEKTIRLKTLESKLTDIINEKQNLDSQYREKAITANERYEQSLKLDERRAALIQELQYQKDLVDYGEKNADLLKEKHKLEAELANVPELANQLRANPQTFEEFKEMQQQLVAAAKAAGKPFKLSLNDIKEAYDDYVKSFDSSNKDYEAKVKRLKEIEGLLFKSDNIASGSKLRTVEVIDEEIKALQQLQKTQADTARKWMEYQQKIDKLNAERNAITGDKNAQKNLEKELKDEQKIVDELLAQTQTYQQKRMLLESNFQNNLYRLKNDGRATTDNIDVLKKQHKKELDELDKEYGKTVEKYRFLYDSIEALSVSMLKDRIEKIKATLAESGLTDEIQSQALKALSAAEDALISRAPLTALKSINGRIATIKASISRAKTEMERSGLEGQLNELETKKAKALSDMFGNVASRLSEASEIAAYFNENLAIAVDLASNLASAFANLAAGNLVQGGIQLAAAVLNLNKTLAEKQAKKEEEARQKRQEASNKLIDEANKLLQQQLNLLDKIRGTDIYSGLASSQTSLNSALDEYIKAVEKLDLKNKDTKYTEWESTWFGHFGQIYSREKKTKYDQYDFSGLNSLMSEALSAPDYQNIALVYEEINKIRNLIKDGTIFGDTDALDEQLVKYEQLLEQAEILAAKQAEILTGSTYDSVVDALAAAFDDGLYSAEEFADTFQELMQKAALNALKINALKGPLDEWYKNFAKLSEGGLTADEVQQLRDAYMTIANNAEQYFENLREITGLTFDNPNGADGGLTGAIKGMSQETAELLAGQLGAIRINVADIAAYMAERNIVINPNIEGFDISSINTLMASSNDYLMQIELNTRQLAEIKNILNRQNIVSSGYNNGFLEQRSLGL